MTLGQHITNVSVLAGISWNKIEIKQFYFSFISDVRTSWNKTETKHWNCFSLISIFFNTTKLFQWFFFSDVRTSEIKLQLNNVADGRLKRNKILFYSRCATGFKQLASTHIIAARQSLMNRFLINYNNVTATTTTALNPVKTAPSSRWIHVKSFLLCFLFECYFSS